MTVPERKAYIDLKGSERAKLQQRITQPNAERVRFVANASRIDSATNALDAAMIRTLREQGGRRNYRFE